MINNTRYSKSRPPPIDRGWAWVILVAQFCQHVIGSSIYMTGLFNVAFLEEFNLSKSATALIGSLHTGLFCCAGPVSSLLISTIGARRTVFLGVAMTMFGHFSSAFVNSYFVICITYGVIAGVGIGFTYLPGVIMMGFYFNRYRNFAFGFVTMAVGIGQICLAPLVNFLIATYGWRGTMMILSGIMGHFAVVGAVLRPVDFDPEFSYDDPDEKAEHVTHEKPDFLSSPTAAVAVGAEKSTPGFTNSNFKTSNDSVSEKGSVPNLSHKTMLSNIYSDTVIIPGLSNGVKDSRNVSNNAIVSPEVLPKSVKLKHSELKTPQLPQKTTVSIAIPIVTGQNRIYQPKNSQTFTPPDKFHSSASIYLSSSAVGVCQPMPVTSQSSTNISNNRCAQSPTSPHRVQSPVVPLEKVLQDTVLARMSSDIMGRSYSSINDIAKTPMMVESNLAVSGTTAVGAVSEPFIASVAEVAPSKLNAALTVLRNPKFTLYCLSLIAVALGQGGVYVHLPAFAISTGTSADRASNLLAVMGLANIISRFLSGLITSGNRCGSLTVYNISLGLNGAFLLLAPVMGQTYMGQIAVALLFSLFGNCYCAIMTPLAIELVGLQGLSIASGLLLLASGVGFLCGPPLAGLLFDLSGSYSTTFYFSGACIIVGMLIMLITGVLKRREQTSKEFEWTVDN